VGLVVIAIAVAWILYMQRGSHIEPVGKILKVRTLAMDENSAVAVIDFRIQNTADFPIVVREVTVTLAEADGKTDDGSSVAEMDAKRLFQYFPVLGEKYNDTLKMHDHIKPHETLDRMIAVRFEIPQARVDGRKTLKLRVEDVDGPSGELIETR
jgi:hypothetical protein